MRKVLLPFFVLALAIVATPSLVRSSRTLLPPLASFLSTLVVLGIVLASYFGQMLPSPTLVAVPQVQADSGVSESELSHWLNLYEQQPTHRDVLINLARLYAFEGNTEKAAFFQQKAQDSDPNAPLFQEQ